MEIKQNIQELRKELASLREKYTKKIEDANFLRKQKEVERSLSTVQDIQKLVEEVSSRVEEGRERMKGILYLARRERGEESTEEGEKSLQKLVNAFYDRKDPIRRFFGKIRRKNLSLQEGLNLLQETVSIIPEYVERLKERLSLQKREMNQLKGNLRRTIEDIIYERLEIVEDKKRLQEGYSDFPGIKQLEAEYTRLERIREKNSSQGNPTDEAVLYRLDSLEVTLAEAKDTYRELNIKDKRAQSNIVLINGQIKKIQEYLELLEKVEDVVADAENYVNVQVPYVIKEIEAQKAEIQALGGINGVVNLLEKQQEVSRKLNERIKIAANYLAERVEEIRQKAIENRSIYPQPLEGKFTRHTYTLPSISRIEKEKMEKNERER